MKRPRPHPPTCIYEPRCYTGTTTPQTAPSVRDLAMRISSDMLCRANGKLYEQLTITDLPAGTTPAVVWPAMAPKRRSPARSTRLTPQREPYAPAFRVPRRRAWQPPPAPRPVRTRGCTPEGQLHQPHRNCRKPPRPSRHRRLHQLAPSTRRASLLRPPATPLTSKGCVEVAQKLPPPRRRLCRHSLLRRARAGMGRLQPRARCGYSHRHAHALPYDLQGTRRRHASSVHALRKRAPGAYCQRIHPHG